MRLDSIEADTGGLRRQRDRQGRLTSNMITLVSTVGNGTKCLRASCVFVLEQSLQLDARPSLDDRTCSVSSRHGHGFVSSFIYPGTARLG